MNREEYERVGTVDRLRILELRLKRWRKLAALTGQYLPPYTHKREAEAAARQIKEILDYYDYLLKQPPDPDREDF